MMLAGSVYVAPFVGAVDATFGAVAPSGGVCACATFE
jgi:hypothetical protein